MQVRGKYPEVGCGALMLVFQVEWIDIERVNIVFNYDMPRREERGESHEYGASNTYLHRVRRYTGRTCWPLRHQRLGHFLSVE